MQHSTNYFLRDKHVNGRNKNFLYPLGKLYPENKK